MSAQLLQKIVNNYHTAIQLHAELASVMWFIALDGYALLHEFQYISESAEMRKVKKYAIETYSVFLPDEIPESANIAIPLLGDRNRREMRQSDTVEILQKAFAEYEAWERKTLALYSDIAIELFDNKNLAASNMVSSIIDDVKAELDMIVNTVMQLEAHAWDMPQIVADQAELCEDYRKKLNKLRLGDL